MIAHDRLDEIEARANAAQASPWRAGRWEDFYGKEVTYSIETSMTSRVADYLSDPDDAQFIAHAREDVPTLVAALRAVQGVHKRIPGPPTECDLCRKAAPGLCSECRTAWPCTSIRAIESALGGA